MACKGRNSASHLRIRRNHFADACQADYIIVGASDRSALMQVLGGSVSTEIVSNANCPVLIVRRIRGQRHIDLIEISIGGNGRTQRGGQLTERF